MRLTTLDHFFWAAGFVANLALLYVLWHRRRAHRFPFFTALFTFGLVKSVLLFAVLHYGTRDEYFWAYWVLTILDMLLQLSVVYELSSQVFRPLETWIHEVRKYALSIVLLSITIAGGLTFLASPPAHTWMQSLATKGNLFAASLMSEMFVAMMVLSAIARRPWRTHAAKIAQGVGAYAAVSVLVETGHSYFGIGDEIPAFLFISHLRMTIYLGCVAYWMLYLWRDEAAPRRLPFEVREKLFTLQAQVDYDLQVLRSREKL